MIIGVFSQEWNEAPPSILTQGYQVHELPESVHGMDLKLWMVSDEALSAQEYETIYATMQNGDEDNLVYNDRYFHKLNAWEPEFFGSKVVGFKREGTMTSIRYDDLEAMIRALPENEQGRYMYLLK